MLSRQIDYFLAVTLELSRTGSAIVPVLIQIGDLGKEASGFIFILEVIIRVYYSLQQTKTYKLPFPGHTRINFIESILLEINHIQQ